MGIATSSALIKDNTWLQTCSVFQGCAALVDFSSQALEAM